jgi:hypothetical protein
MMSRQSWIRRGNDNMANHRKIIAITTYSVKIFDSVAEACDTYGITYAKLQKLIETGQTLEDGKTSFDDLLEEGDLSDE